MPEVPEPATEGDPTTLAPEETAPADAALADQSVVEPLESPRLPGDERPVNPTGVQLVRKPGSILHQLEVDDLNRRGASQADMDGAEAAAEGVLAGEVAALAKRRPDIVDKVTAAVASAQTEIDAAYERQAAAESSDPESTSPETTTITTPDTSYPTTTTPTPETTVSPTTTQPPSTTAPPKGGPEPPTTTTIPSGY